MSAGRRAGAPAPSPASPGSPGSPPVDARIYAMAQGRIVERGTHDELMAIDGMYAGLYTAQADQFRPERAATV